MKKPSLPRPAQWRKRGSIASTVILIALILYCVILFTPMIWSTVISFMTDGSFRNIFGSVRDYDAVRHFTFENFTNAWTELQIVVDGVVYKIVDLFLNSIIYSVGSALAFTICPCIVAYATARFKFKFSKIIYGLVIVAMALPIIGSSASELRMLDFFGLRETRALSYLGMFILRFNFLSIYYLVFYAQFEMIPKDYTEASKIDGASNWKIMTRVIFPQARGTIITVFILSFVTFWNDFQIPFLYMPKNPTVSYAVYYITVASAGFGTVPKILAGVILLTLPIVILFIALNKRMRVSVDMGGIKG